MKIFNKKTISRKERIIVDKENILYKLESYHKLRDNVIYSLDEGKNKILQIASSVSGEAKSTTVSNLGVLLAETGKKVLIIDLDFRRANIHKIFKVDSENGLAEFMLGKIDIETATKSTSYENLNILPRGARINNPAIIFISDKFTALLQQLRSKYDVILLDTSPVLLTSDYIHLSKLSDITLFLCAYGKTRKKEIKEAVKELKKNGANIIGSVLTFYADKERASKKYYANYYYLK